MSRGVFQQERRLHYPKDSPSTTMGPIYQQGFDFNPNMDKWLNPL